MAVLRDMSVSPISAPGVGRKKKRKKHQSKPEKTTRDESASISPMSDAGAGGRKVKKKKKAKEKVKDQKNAQRVAAVEASPDHWMPSVEPARKRESETQMKEAREGKQPKEVKEKKDK